MNSTVRAFVQLKIKNFVHKHPPFETILLVIWGIFCIMRSHLIFKNIKHLPPHRDYKAIVLSVRTLPSPGLIYFDAMFAHAFRKLGAQAKMLFADGVLTSTDAATVFRGEKPQQTVSLIWGGLLKKSLHTDTISYRDYLNQRDIQAITRAVQNLESSAFESHTYLGVHVGLHAQASTVRYFLSGHVDLKDKNHVRIFREKLVNAMISTLVASKVVEKENPQLLFLLHGIYSTWGPFLEYFRNCKIDTIMYGNMPSRFGHFIFYRNAKVNEMVSRKAWEEFSKLPLTPEEEEAVDRYFRKRVSGSDGDQKMYENNFNLSSPREVILQELSRTHYAYRFVMYTNLAWDVYVEGHESKIFTDVFHWIDTTIAYFMARPDCQLIIKPHPGELIWDKCSQGVRDYVIENYSNLPSNISVLPPNTPVTAYDLLTKNTIGMVYNGSLGLDFANLGIPALVVANIHYKDAGIVYPVDTLEEYMRFLHDPTDLFAFASSNVKLAKKYAYFYYYKAMIRIPFYQDSVWSTFDWRVMGDTEALLEKNAPLMKVAKKIIEREDILNPL